MSTTSTPVPTFTSFESQANIKRNDTQTLIKTIHDIHKNIPDHVSKTDKLIANTGTTPTLVERSLAVQNLIRPMRARGMSESELTGLQNSSIKHSITFGEIPEKIFQSYGEMNEKFPDRSHDSKLSLSETNFTLSKALNTSISETANYLETLLPLFTSSEKEISTFFETLAGRTALLAEKFNFKLNRLGKNLGISATTGLAANIPITEIITVMGIGTSRLPNTEAGSGYKTVLENATDAGSRLGLNLSDNQGGIIKMAEMLDRLKGKFGETLDAAEKNELSKAFGSNEAANLIETLLKSANQFKATLIAIEQVDGLGPALKLAEKMVDPWARMNSSISAVWSSLGPELENQLAIIAEGMAWLAIKTIDLIEQFPLLGEIIVVTGLIIMGLALTAGALKIGIVAVSAVMTIWNAIIWLSNAAFAANPLVLIVMAVAALIAIVIAATFYWDEFCQALLEDEAFKTIIAWFETLSNWFNSMGGWSGLASAAWDSIVNIFNQSLNALIEMLNNIPGVSIETRFGTPAEAPGQEQLAAAERARATIASATPSLLNSGDANKVPPGGLLRSIQNSTQQNRSTHVEKVEIHTSKSMTSHDLQGLLEMTG